MPTEAPDRERCPRCRRPVVACWCRDLPSLPTRTRVVFLQHPREARVAIGTARMAHLCLPNSEIHVGVEFANDAGVLAAVSDPDRPALLLFPGPDAPDILQAPPQGPATLVVVDGTWSQAAKLVHRNPVLAALPRYAFRPPNPSEYRIRREPREECVSTIEALVHVLGALEGDPSAARCLLEPFRTMVDFQVRHAETSREPRRRIRQRPAPPAPVPPAPLLERPGDLVCAAGEANAWPRAADPRVPDELVHWVAVRPATGERFEALIAPRRPLAPSTPNHAEIPEPRLRSGESWDAFEARWAAFLRPDDVLCTWGCHYSNLLASEGGALPAGHLDIRQVLRDLTKRHVGSLENWVAAAGREAPPIGEGRAGLRLGLLADVVVRLCREARPDRGRDPCNA